jgi:hypothetical protein
MKSPIENSDVVLAKATFAIGPIRGERRSSFLEIMSINWLPIEIAFSELNAHRRNPSSKPQIP